MKEVIEKLVSKHTLNLSRAKTLEDYAKTENNFTKELLEVINYTRCSLQLPDVEKEKLIDNSYWLNLQNLSGREHFDKAFRLGIEVGVEELTEHLQNKAIV